MNPLPVPFARRALKRVDETGPGEHEFTVVTYNILADYWMQMVAIKKGKDLYSYCPSDHKISKQYKFSPRRALFIEELRWLNGDIVCLQGVDTPYFEDILADEMSRMGYQGLFAPKRIPEGVASFFKKDMFEIKDTKIVYVDDQAACAFSKLEEFPILSEVLLLAALKHKSSDNLLLIANALADMVASYESRGKHVSHILCGDFDIEPQFPAYQLVKEGRLHEKEIEALKSVEDIRWDPNTEQPSQLLPDQMSLLNKAKEHFHHPLKNLQSAYKTVLGVEPQFTNHEGPGCVWTSDYIWFDSENLIATAALETVSKAAIEPYKGLPNQDFPSDHLSLKAHFKFTASW